MPASTLPTRSEPTSAALVKMPPPTRANSAMELAPKPKPATTLMFWNIRYRMVTPSSPMPTTDMPITVPLEKATRSAGFSPRMASGGRPHVGPHRHVHPDEPGRARADGPHQVRNCRGRHRHLVFEYRIVQHAQHHRHHHHEGQQRHILAAQERPRPGADGVADALHQLVAGFGAKHPHRGYSSKNKGNNACGQCNNN